MDLFITIFLFIQIISAILISYNYCVRLNKIFLFDSKTKICEKISFEKKKNKKKMVFLKNYILKFDLIKVFLLFISQKTIFFLKSEFFRVSKKNSNRKKKKIVKNKKIEKDSYLQNLLIKRNIKRKIFELNLKFIRNNKCYPLPKIKEIKLF